MCISIESAVGYLWLRWGKILEKIKKKLGDSDLKIALKIYIEEKLIEIRW